MLRKQDELILEVFFKVKKVVNILNKNINENSRVGKGWTIVDCSVCLNCYSILL